MSRDPGRFEYVGRRLPKTDALAKVIGQARYVYDLSRPGMLHGKILYSDRPHARILNVDASRARRLAGVKAVLTAWDIPEVRVGFLKDNPLLKKDKVRSFKDEIACLAAISEDVAQEALTLIRVEYEDLPAVFDPLAALAPEAPLIHEFDGRGRPLASNRLNLNWRLAAGDVDRARREAAHVVEGRYQTTWVAHCCLGPSGCLAEFDANRNPTLHSITQIPFLAQNDFSRLLEALGLPDKTCRVVGPTIGGGFGSKLDTHHYEYLSLILAHVTGRPVRILFDREEEFRAQPPRQPAVMDVAQGCDQEGRLLFRDIRMILDNGAYTSWGATTPSVMMVPVSSLYRVPNVRYQAECVYTNNLYAQAMRGYGNPQATFAVESSMDELARAAGIDPLEFRLINANRPNETTPMRLKVTTCGLRECLSAVAGKLGYANHRRAKPRGRGIGLASLIHVGGGARVYKSDGHGLIMKMDDFGKVTVISGAVEIGQGGDTIIRQVAAEALGVRLEDVTLIQHDTALCPWDVGTHASRQAFVAGNATLKAAARIKSELRNVAAQMLQAEPGDVDVRDRVCFVKTDPDNPGRRVPVDKVLRRLHFSSQGRVLMAEAFYDPPNEMLDHEFKGNISCNYAFGVTGVEVEVDEETGRVEILRYVAAHDVGRALNPLLLEGQIHGGAVMGVGMALTEELKLVDGRVANDNFLDYKLLTALDKVPVEPVIVETLDEAGPYGAKGVGEPGCVPVAPALANAIYDAVGVRITSLPITPEKLLRAIKEKKGLPLECV